MPDATEKRRGAFLNFPSDNACVFERFVQPARFCAPDWAKIGYEIGVGEGIPDNYECVAFNGLPNHPGVMAILGVKKSHGVKVLWSVDDSWENIPPWNPAKPDDSMLLAHDIMRSACDLILTSTPHLAGTFADVSHKVLCAPNLVDLSRFPPPRFQGDESPIEVKLPVRVVWSGSHTHRGDIELLEGVVQRLFKRFTPDELSVCFCGMVPPKSLVRDHLHRGVVYQPTVPIADYRRVMNAMRPDVWLAPLAEIPFNLSKSNLRVLEGWALSAAVVATPWGEYNCVRSGLDGRLAKDEDAWVSALERLVSDHAYRRDLAYNGRKRVESEFNWWRRDNRRAWDNVWSRVFGVPVPE